MKETLIDCKIKKQSNNKVIFIFEYVNLCCKLLHQLELLMTYIENSDLTTNRDFKLKFLNNTILPFLEHPTNGCFNEADVSDMIKSIQNESIQVCDINKTHIITEHINSHNQILMLDLVTLKSGQLLNSFLLVGKEHTSEEYIPILFAEKASEDGYPNDSCFFIYKPFEYFIDNHSVSKKEILDWLNRSRVKDILTEDNILSSKIKITNANIRLYLIIMQHNNNQISEIIVNLDDSNKIKSLVSAVIRTAEQTKIDNLDILLGKLLKINVTKIFDVKQFTLKSHCYQKIYSVDYLNFSGSVENVVISLNDNNYCELIRGIRDYIIYYNK